MATAARPPPARRPLRGVVFDMDGCVALSSIDFREMRRRIGAPPGVDILEHVGAMPTEAERKAALAAIAEVEHAAVAGMRLAPGALAFARELDALRVPRALVTRNVLRSLNHFHALHWVPGGRGAGGGGAEAAGGGGEEGGGGAPADEVKGAGNGGNAPFHPAITRECGLRHKPHPDALEHIARAWGVDTRELAMVGDSAFDDVASGRRAGSVTLLIDAAGEYDHEWDDGRDGQRDEVQDGEEEHEEEEEEEDLAADAAVAAAAGAAAAPGAPPASPRRGELGGKRAAKYLVGERTPHHKVPSMRGVRDALLGEGSRYDLIPMPLEAWERRRAEAAAAAEAAHAAVAADLAGSWQALE